MFYGLYHGKSPFFTTIWENMCYLFQASSKEIQGKLAASKKIIGNSQSWFEVNLEVRSLFSTSEVRVKWDIRIGSACFFLRGGGQVVGGGGNGNENPVIWGIYVCFRCSYSNSYCNNTVDGWNLANHLGWCWNPINNGINYQPKLVSRISAINSIVGVESSSLSQWW